ncbi:MAG: FtsX-like permease family protein [Bacteroidota bacterium]
MAFRVFLKHSLSSFITLIGLSGGIGCFLALLIYVYDESQTDRFHSNYENIYHVDMQHYVNDEPMFSIPPPAGVFYDLNSIKEITAGTRAFCPKEVTVSVGETKFKESGFVFADSSWIDVFDFKYLTGDFSTFNDPSKVIVSERVVRKYFKDQDPLGKIITIDKENYTIGNVILEEEQNSSLNINFLVTYRKRKDFGVDPDSYLEGHTPYFVVSKTNSTETLQHSVQLLIDNKLDDPPFKVKITSLQDYYFEGSTNIKFQNAGIRGNKRFYNTFIIIAILILFVAIINYINLVTARATERAKEVGIKKTIGARRSGLATQFQIESLFLTFTAGIIAFGMAELLLRYLNKLLAQPVDHFLLVSPAFFLIYILLLLCISCLSGLYPSFILSSFKPLSAVKNSDKKFGGRAWLRNSLTTFQFVITTVLIFGSTVIAKQMKYLADFNLGFDTDQILSIDASNDMQKSFRAIKPTLLSLSGVEYASVGNLPGIGWMYAGEFKDKTVNVAMQHVDEDFLSVAGLTLLEGRPLVASDEGTTNILINKTMRDLLFGEEETSFGKLRDRETNLVGVVADFEFSSARSPVMPLELKVHKNKFRNILIRISKGSNARSVVSQVKQLIQEEFPDEVFSYRFLDKEYDQQYKAENLFLDLLQGFSLVCISIGCIGLFGLAQYSFTKGLKVIGIKKILGAGDRRVIRDLLKGLIVPVFMGLVIGLPIGLYFMKDWLSGYANRIDLDVMPFLLTSVTIFLIALITVMYQVVNAVHLKPVSALQKD